MQLQGAQQHQQQQNEKEVLLQGRVEFLENAVGSVQQQMQEESRLVLQVKQQMQEEKEELHANIIQRITFLERAVGDSADSHDRHRAELLLQLQDLYSHVRRQADWEKVHDKVDARLQLLERSQGTYAERHAELEAEHRKLLDFQKKHGETTEQEQEKRQCIMDQRLECATLGELGFWLMRSWFQV